MRTRREPHLAIACGGTGGHLFPGLAVGTALQRSGCEITLLVSDKKVDQSALSSVPGMHAVTLPAVGLQRDELGGFLRGLWSSVHLCIREFKASEPDAVFTTGGFTGVPALLAGKAMGLATFLHEANSIPGRANRLLAPWVDDTFAWFPQAVRRLSRRCIHSGMPLRAQMQPLDPGACRSALGLDPQQAVVLIMGGSQGASAVNLLVMRAAPFLRRKMPRLQIIHLAGPKDEADLVSCYEVNHLRARVFPFLTEMELALGAANVVVSRSGASSLAEFAAVGLPPILIPYPAAADNHQYFNARAFADSGAALQLEQGTDTPETLAESVIQLIENQSKRTTMRAALQQWHRPNAAEEIAESILGRVRQLTARTRVSFASSIPVGSQPALIAGGERVR